MSTLDGGNQMQMWEFIHIYSHLNFKLALVFRGSAAIVFYWLQANMTSFDDISGCPQGPS